MVSTVSQHGAGQDLRGEMTCMEAQKSLAILV